MTTPTLRLGRLALPLALALACAGRASAQATIDHTWLQTNADSSRATFALLAGLRGVNGGMNFNGAANGTLVFTVPVGWHVTMKYRNADQMQPHSAVILPLVTPLPATAGRPAFAGATTRQVMQGTPPGGHEDFSFTADHAGEFMIYCGVPGHGMAGMWIRLTVSADAHQPGMSLHAK
jgi:FtsP/CotA-like multicopper oxidase with cupredoxin domain